MLILELHTDLVSQRCAKNVVLCLLEVARIACSLLQFTPCPGLVQVGIHSLLWSGAHLEALKSLNSQFFQLNS